MTPEQLKMVNMANAQCLYYHQNQTDKAGLPYIWHPIRMAQRTNNADEKVVCLLHDLLEDTDCKAHNLYFHFPDHIVKAVQLLTKKKCDTYKDYLLAIRENRLAKTVKLLDLEDNSDVTRLCQLDDALAARLADKYGAAKSYLLHGGADAVLSMDERESKYIPLSLT